MVADEGDKKALFAHQPVEAAGQADRVAEGEGGGFPAEIAQGSVWRHVGFQERVITMDSINPGVPRCKSHEQQAFLARR